MTNLGFNSSASVSTGGGVFQERKGAILFTGPDGMRDQRVQVEADHRYIGHTTASPEATGDLNYICRAAEVS